MRGSFVLTLAVLTPLTLAAQANPDARTLGWLVRGDRPNANTAALSFVEMKPGFHVTTKSFSGILYHPEMTATGTFEATMKVYLFKPQSNHNEGYGIFLGGKNLAGDEQQYVYFLLRNNGQFLIKTRNGTETADVIPWTAHEAITVRPADAADDATALNTLHVRATNDAVQFLVNGVVVATRPRSELAVEGIVGIRANHFLDLHISEIEVASPGAPTRP